MQTLIKEYGETILAAVVSVLVIGLIFGGLSMIGKLGVITGKLDSGIVKEVEAASEQHMKRHMEAPADNIAMSGDVLVQCGRKIYYCNDGSALIDLRNGKGRRIHISSVYLLRDGGSDDEGYNITDQVLHEGESEDGADSYLEFLDCGNYRLVVNVTDGNNIVSDYQVFVTAVRRRRV